MSDLVIFSAVYAIFSIPILIIFIISVIEYYKKENEELEVLREENKRLQMQVMEFHKIKLVWNNAAESFLKSEKQDE